MRNLLIISLIAASSLAGCNFQNASRPMLPTSPGSVGNTSTTGSTSTGGSNPASAFSGSWASSTIGGLPIGNCSDLKWTLTTQSATTIAGTVSATCSSGASVAANLVGQMQGESTITFTASGTITMAGLPCAFNMVGTGTRQGDDSMKLDYAGTYCLGNLSGSEVLRRFPNI